MQHSQVLGLVGVDPELTLPPRGGEEAAGGSSHLGKNNKKINPHSPGQESQAGNTAGKGARAAQESHALGCINRAQGPWRGALSAGEDPPSRLGSVRGTRTPWRCGKQRKDCTSAPASTRPRAEQPGSSSFRQPLRAMSTSPPIPGRGSRCSVALRHEEEVRWQGNHRVTIFQAEKPWPCGTDLLSWGSGGKG